MMFYKFLSVVQTFSPIISALISAIVAWFVAGKRAKAEISKLEKEHELSALEHQREREETKADTFESGMKEALATVTVYLNQTYNMWNKNQAFIAIGNLIASAPDTYRTTLIALRDAIEREDVQSAAGLRSELESKLSGHV